MLKRLLFVTAGSFLLAFLAPVSAGSAALAAGAVVVSGVLLGVAASRAFARRDALSEQIALELNKIRRVYHLSKNLGEEPRHRQWFTELHGALYGYLTAFDKKDFSRYQETNGAFRKMSYHLYKIAGLETEKERVLYRELLDAAGEVAGARQRIQDLWNGGIAPQQWNAMLAAAVLSSAAVLMAMGPSDRFVAALVVSALGCAVMAVRDIDAMHDLADADLSKRYVENIARLELRRDE